MKRKVVVALIASLAIAQVGVGVVKRNQYVVNAKSPSNVSVQNVQKTLDESFFEKMVEKGILIEIKCQGRSRRICDKTGVCHCIISYGSKPACFR